MPDLTKCFGYDSQNGVETRICPMAERCYRKTATPTPMRQSYFLLIPLKADDTCDRFIEAVVTGDR